MTPDKENNMRGTLAEYAKSELVDLAISLQDVVDGHIHENKGLQTSINAMKGQIPILQAELDKYEGAAIPDSEEVEALEQQVNLLNIRVGDLQTLNEKLQHMLVGD